MAGKAFILDDDEVHTHLLFSGEGRNPGRCVSSAAALPWTPAYAGEPGFGEVDR